MRKVLNVPYIDQTLRWPTGCESVSSVMLCQYLGIAVPVDRFITEYLPTEPMRFCGTGDGSVSHSNSTQYDYNIGFGPDPDEFFAGSPYDEDSFGCYPGVIVKALNACFADKGGKAARNDADAGCGISAAGCVGLEAIDASGWETERYLDEIRAGRPVVYWASIDLKPTIRGPRWSLSESAGDRAGTEFTWISNEHCMLLVGFDEEKDTLVFADPWHAHGIIDYPRGLVEARHAEQGGRAVAVRTL